MGTRFSSHLARRPVLLGGLLFASTHRALATSAVDAASLVRPGDPILGNPHGRLTIVDFYDIRCPPCRALDPRIQRLLAVDHQIRYVPIDYPILGAPSLLGVEALFAAQNQGKYAALRARLMKQVAAPTMAIVKADAKALQLDWPRMELAMSGDAIARRVAANLARGKALGVTKIPALFIRSTAGFIGSTAGFIGTIRISGALSYEHLVSVVAQARRQSGGGTPAHTAIGHGKSA